MVSPSGVCHGALTTLAVNAMSDIPPDSSARMDAPAVSARLRRRQILLALAAGAAPVGGAWAAPSADSTPIRIAQSTALSGPLGALGTAMHEGAKACFAVVNAKGGVQGRPIELAVADDGYDVKRALANVSTFMDDARTLALFNCMGTPMVEAMLPKVIESGIPFFAPFTGALSVRNRKARNVFHIRANYAEESDQLVQHLATVGIRRIAVVYQNNAFGKEVFNATQKALQRLKMQPVAVATVENDANDAAAAASKIAAAAPEAVLLGTAGKPTVEFARLVRQERKGLQMYALSVMGTASTLKAMGADAVGMTISQIVPLPNNRSTPVVRDFQNDWKALKGDVDASHLALEGYVNARVFVEALRRSGRNLSRSALIDAIWTIRRLDLGGYAVNFSENEPNASRFVELTMVARDGRFIR